MSHEIIKCECGNVLAQCRCPALNGEKPVKTVRPCRCVKPGGPNPNATKAAP